MMSGMVNTKTTTLDELAIAVIAWADERDLTHPDNAFRQILKVMEEVGELSGAMSKQRSEHKRRYRGRPCNNHYLSGSARL